MNIELVFLEDFNVGDLASPPPTEETRLKFDFALWQLDLNSNVTRYDGATSYSLLHKTPDGVVMSNRLVMDSGLDMNDIDLHYVTCVLPSGKIYSWRLDPFIPKGGILLVTYAAYSSSYESDIEKGIGEPTDRSMRAFTKIILDLLDTMPRRKSS